MRILDNNLREATITPISKNTLASVIRDATDISLRKAKTIADTAISGLQRTVADSVAKQLPRGAKRFFFYVGPLDGKTRDFCRALEGKAIPEHLFRRLRNKSKLPVKKYGGGYNCRHTILPITDAIVKAKNIPIATSDDVNRANRGKR